MLLEDYFEFLSPIDIRLKGTRVGIEHVLYHYLYAPKSPEEIVQQFSSVTLEQVYATILYYLHNPEPVGQYVAEWLEHTEKAAAEQDANPPDYVLRLRALREQLRTQKQLEKQTEQIHS